jgi:hypothetical protein
VSAAANGGYQFSGFTGTLSGTATPRNLTMTAPAAVTANFILSPSAITITSAPAGLSLLVDGSACTAPCSVQWTAGTNHTIAATPSPQAGGAGVQYVFANWSDGGAQSHSVSAPSSAATYTANFTPAPSGGTASFVKTDTTTAGTWKGAYGADGSNVINDQANYPAYVTATVSGNGIYTWAGSTTAITALQKASSSTDRIAACWFSSASFSIDLRFNDTGAHQVALYLLDWDVYGGGRSQRVDILDASNNTLLDSRSISGFANGQYLVWNLSGHVTVRITNLNGYSNAVLSGILFR